MRSEFSEPATYTYDSRGRLLTAANGTDTLAWTYDLAGQLLSESSSKNSSTVAYTYDLGGNRLSVSLGGTVFVTYAYDDASRLATITRASSNFAFGYDDANHRTSMTYPNGITTGYSYDDLNRLTRLKADLGATPITDFLYAYDNAGNRTRKQQLDYTEDYSYDPLYRLTGVERSAGLTGIWHYGYDTVGNRVTAQTNDSVLTSIFNEKNQLTNSSGGGTLKLRGTLNEPGTAKVNGSPARMLAGNVFEATIQATTGTNTFAVEATDQSANVTTKNYQVSVSATGAIYTYDPNGNLTQKVEGPDTWTYEWTAENLLKRVLKNSVEQARFAYDPNGRRVEKVIGGITTTYLHSGLDVLREQSGTVRLYVHGPAVDEPLAIDDGSGALSYYQADELGSVVSTTNSAGAIAQSRQYDAWGNLLTGATVGSYAFAGREWEPETQLYFYRARFYDAKIGRFLSEDPLGFQADGNFYRYVLDNPVNLIDPMGLDVQVCTRQAKNLPEGLPHTVVYPTSRKTKTGPGTGPCIASGFGPAKGLPVGAGAIFDEPICDDYGNRSPAYSCSTVSTSDCVEKCVERKIGESKKNPPRYQVGPKFLGGNQCTDWSDKIVSDCQKECAGGK
jgi:RHS repeat-associated protein